MNIDYNYNNTILEFETKLPETDEIKKIFLSFKDTLAHAAPERLDNTFWKGLFHILSSLCNEDNEINKEIRELYYSKYEDHKKIP